MIGEVDAANVRQLKHQDMIAFFDDFIHHTSPTRRKLSIYLTSQQKSPTRFSVEASEALLEILKAEDVPVEEEQYRQLSAAQPPLEAVLGFWTKQLESHASAASILARIPDIAAKHPIEGEPSFPEGATRIDDVASFKSRMTASKAPTPVGSS